MKDLINLYYFSDKLEKVSPRYRELNKDMKDIPSWFKILSASLTAVELAACASGYLPPTISSEQGNPLDGRNTFSVIPTQEEEGLNNNVYQTETYCSKDLALCVFHQFDKDGKALAPRAFINSNINYDLDNNTVIVTGDPFIHNDNEVTIYPEHDGQKGYETLQVMSVENALKWMDNMSEKNQEGMLVVIDEARNKGVDVRILMKTVLNIQKDQDGNDKLVDMTVGVALSGGGDESSIVYLGGLASPISNNDLLKDQQIAAVDFVPQFNGTENLVMKVYPSNWIEIGNGEYVSPEFVIIQDQIAASGEKFTLMPNGIVQEKTLDGVKDITGLSIDKRGQRIVTVNGENIIINSEDLIISDQDGIKISGYTFDTQTGLWSMTESPLPTELEGSRYLAKFDKTEEGTKIVDGIETKVIFGVKEGKNNKVIAMEIDGRMTRVGEHKDELGNSFYVYMKPGYDIGGRVEVTDITADILFGTGNSKADVNLFKSIGTQFGLDPEAMKAKILEDDGLINFKVAVGNGEGSANNFRVKFTELPNKADFNKPIEIITVGTNADLDKLTKEFESQGINLANLLVTVRGTDPAYPHQISNLLWVKPDGQMQIISVQTSIETTPWVLDPKTNEEKAGVNEYIAARVGGNTMKSIELISATSRGRDALSYLMRNSQNNLINIAKRLFEYSNIKN